jgi:hypothetical protein
VQFQQKSLHGGLNDPKSIELKNKKKCEVSTEVAFMSQHGDDESLFDTFFSDPLKCEGTVVEIGGLNGKMFSNSWFFQYALNWRVLLVEASPTNYANMIQNRPDDCMYRNVHQVSNWKGHGCWWYSR